MTHIEMMPRLSLVQVELAKIADGLRPEAAKVVQYSAKVLGLLRNPNVTASNNVGYEALRPLVPVLEEA